MTRVNSSAALVRGRHTSFIWAAIAALLVAGSASSARAAGTISGQITSSVTHTGIAGAEVLFFDVTDDDGNIVATATADATGNYSQSLPDGSYALLTRNAQGYINKAWNNVSCSATCDVDSVTPLVVSGGDITGINFELSPGGRIAGTVTAAATGAPIAGALVFFVDGDGNFPFSTATTDSLGNYLSDGGSETGNVLVITLNAQGYQDESYNNHKCTIEACDTADPVAVTLGATTTGIDFALDLGGRIAGTVRDISNSPLANVTVQINDATGERVDEVLTDGSGNFITGGLPTGIYYAGTDNTLGLVDYLWNNFLCAGGFCDQTSGTPISVTVPSTTTGINFVLPPGQTISGTVTAAAGGAPLEDVFINLMNASGASVGGGRTDASGTFSTGAVPPGTYFANTFATGWVNQLYDNISCPTNCPVTVATPIVVFDQPVTSIDFSLIASGTGSITGTVINGATSLPFSGVSVQLFSPNGQNLASTTTNGSGVYTFASVAAGSYYVRTGVGLQINGTAFINEVYNDVPCVNCAVATSGGTLVTVTNGGTTSGIDFTLAQGGIISGTVTAAATNAPLSGIGAQVFTSANVSVGTFNTNASGNFTTNGLPPGTYYVRTTNAQGYINQLWQNGSCPQAGCVVTNGTPVVVTGTATTSGINFALALGGRISGKVTDATNSQPLQFVTVTVFSSSGVNLGGVSTNASGDYTTSGLPAGSYFVRTASGPLFVNNEQLAFVDQLYSGTQCVPACLNPTVGTPVMVASGTTTTNINFALSRGGSISGAVIDTATGSGLGSVGVQIYTSGGVFAKSAGTNVGGGYTVAGLPPGTYYARTSMPSGVFYQDGLYNGLSCSSGCTVTTGTPITVLSGVISHGVNFALTSGAGGISGAITDARTAAPLAGISVQIYDAAGVFTKTAITNPLGTFATSGLAPGTYYARTLHEFVPPLHTNQLYSGARCGPGCTVTSGTPIVVGAGATTTGIDFALPGLLTKSDFDADGKTDLAVWRPPTGAWYAINSSTNGLTSRIFGAGYAPYFDVPVPGDYDGDGKTDFAVWRPPTGAWHVVNSSTNSITSRTWGAGYAPYDDIPVPGDYDGDGKTDLAVWRPSTGIWYVIRSSNNSLLSRTFGGGYAPYNDIPVPADYDGDGKTDLAVWRPATGVWYVIRSSDNGLTSRAFGGGYAPYNDVPVPADYDGDGKTDFAVWRPPTGGWYVVNSSTNSITSRTWGAGYAPYDDIPVPGDYDGDGKTDLAVWRPSTGVWYAIRSSNNSMLSRAFGGGYAPYNDVAVPAFGIR